MWQPVPALSLCTTCDPGRRGVLNLPSRLLRHFCTILQPEPSEIEQKRIYEVVLLTHVQRGQSVEQAIVELMQSVSAFAVELCLRMRDEFPSTAAHPHYSFNMRDVSKFIAGLVFGGLQASTSRLNVARLSAHEALRVFHDRLVGEDHRSLCRKLVCEGLRRHFREHWQPQRLKDEPILFTDFVDNGVKVGRTYVEVTGMAAITTVRQLAEDLTVQLQSGDALTIFDAALEHVLRLVRVLRQPGGHMMLAGPSGVGKKTLARLATYILKYECTIVDSAQASAVEAFHELLSKIFFDAVVHSKRHVILLSFSGICEAVMEDINSWLTSGDVPGLFERDEFDRILDQLATQNMFAASLSRYHLTQTYLARLRDNVHAVMCVTSRGRDLLSIVRSHPSLVTRFTIDWYDNWPQEALTDVARARLYKQPYVTELAKADAALVPSVASCSVKAHLSVASAAAAALPPERNFDAAPAVYFELLHTLIAIIDRKRADFAAGIERLESGLRMLTATRQTVLRMQKELEILAPELSTLAARAALLLAELQKEQEAVSLQEAAITAEEAALQAETKRIEQLAMQAQEELDAALPALEQAHHALDALDKSDIAEIRVYSKPPEMVMRVMGAVCVLLDKKDDWSTAKHMLADAGFLRLLMAYDKDAIPRRILQLIAQYVADPRFTPDEIGKISNACRSICMWVRAIDSYARVLNTVVPKRDKCATLKRDLEKAFQVLSGKQLDLAHVQVQLSRIRERYAASVMSRDELDQRMEQARLRMARANELMTILHVEEQRWLAEVSDLEGQRNHLVGNSLLAACSVVYLGSFEAEQRRQLMALWKSDCMAADLMCSERFALSSYLGNSALADRWRNAGLPDDEFSMENAIIIANCRRYPLIIDPQGQANAWIRKLETASWLFATSPTDPNMLRTIQSAMRAGRPVLLEDVSSVVDPQLESLLHQHVRHNGGRAVIRIGDQDIDFDRNFRLYMTSRLSSPRFPPSLGDKVTIVSFALSIDGLEDQLLSDVVQKERPRLERKRAALITSIAADQADLRETEDKILRLLGELGGSVLLDGTELIETLREAKHTAKAIKKRMRQAEETKAAINSARRLYLPLARRGATLCFVLSDLARVDATAQFALSSFKEMFLAIVDSLADKDERIRDTKRFEAHLLVVQGAVTKAVFERVARGLLSSSRMLFSLLLAAAMQKTAGVIKIDSIVFQQEAAEAAADKEPRGRNIAKLPVDPDETITLTGTDIELPKQDSSDEEDGGERESTVQVQLSDDFSEFHTVEEHLAHMSGTALPIDVQYAKELISNEEWDYFTADFDSANSANDGELAWLEAKARLLEAALPVFRGAAVDVRNNTVGWQNLRAVEHPFVELISCIGEQWASLTGFQRLILIKHFVPEKLIISVKSFASSRLGKEYVEPPSFDLAATYSDSTAPVPILFLLAQGSDPIDAFMRFVRYRNMTSRCSVVSLGRGLGTSAADMVRRAMRAGEWVYLQNCHLAQSWMPVLEGLVANIQASAGGRDAALNPAFRLWLSSAPAGVLPSNVLQTALKVCVEPPQGVRSTLLNTFCALAGPSNMSAPSTVSPNVTIHTMHTSNSNMTIT